MTSFDRWFFRNVVYRGAVVSRGEQGVFWELASLREIEQDSGGQLEQLHHARLFELLRYAHARSPWYRERLPGSPPPSPEALSDYLARVPLLEKRDLRIHREDLLAHPPPARVTVKTTGGSTGEAVTVTKDRASIAREMAASWLGYGWFGVQIGDRAVRFWGDPFSTKRKLRFIASDLAMHRIRFSAFAFDDEALERYWVRCRRFDPDYIYGYASMIVALARFVRDQAIDGRELGLKVVITTSEVLHDIDRAILEETFGCPVQNEYGCGEVGPIAYSCPHGRLHIMSTNVHVEVVDPGGRRLAPGESGEIVITDLGNRAMPLVRYRVGDRGILGEAGCPCGRPFPILEKIWGRAYDFVQSPEGKRYHGEFFMYLFEEMRDRGLQFERFQIRQVAEDRLEVLVVAERMDPQLEEIVRKRIQDQIPGIQLHITQVPDIPRTHSGKTRVVVNEIAEG